MGRHQGRSGQVRKISPPPGFDPRTVQPVGSRYTDYVTRPGVLCIVCVLMCTVLLPAGGNPIAVKNISICIMRYGVIMFGIKCQPEELRPHEGPGVHPTGDGHALAE